MKIIIIGASHGGHESAIELLDKEPQAEVTIYEKGDFVSFLSCGMQLYLEDKVSGVDDVRNFRPEAIETKGGKVKSGHEVTAINADKHEVTVKELATGKTFTDSYDKLILSSGVTPAPIPVPGNDLDNIFFMRGRDWALKIKEKLTDPAIKNVSVIGAGYIGIEAAEVFVKAGKNVTVIDFIDRALGNYLDCELTDILETHLKENSMTLATGEKITQFAGSSKVTAVITEKQTIPADLVIIAAGVKPNTDWLKGTLELEPSGHIKISDKFETTLPDVYAVGDAILPKSLAIGKPVPIALATAARREARYVVHQILGKNDVSFAGLLGTSALSVFDYKFAMTGVNTFNAKRSGVKIGESFYQDTLRPDFVKNDGNVEVFVKLNYDPETKRILGGQVLSTYDVTAQINALALAITNKMTLEELAEADFFFQPGFDRQWSLLNLAAKHALGEAPF